MKKRCISILFLFSLFFGGSVFALDSFNVEVNLNLPTQKIEKNVPFSAEITVTISGTGASCKGMWSVEGISIAKIGLRGINDFFDLGLDNVLAEMTTCENALNRFKLVKTQTLYLNPKKAGEYRIGPGIAFVNNKEYASSGSTLVQVLETNKISPTDPGTTEEFDYDLPANLLGYFDMNVYIFLLIGIIVFGSYFFFVAFEIEQDRQAKNLKKEQKTENDTSPELFEKSDSFEEHMLSLLRTHLAKAYKIDTQKYTLSDLVSLESDSLKKEKLQELVKILAPALYGKAAINREVALQLYKEFISL